MLGAFFANSPIYSIASSGNLAAFPSHQAPGCLAGHDLMFVIHVLAVDITAGTRCARASGHYGRRT